MKPNIGGVDKIVRLVVGLAIVGIGAFFRSWWGLIGLIPLATAWFSFCPLYVPFGINTCSEQPEKQGPASQT